jgi:hypothetical protein
VAISSGDREPGRFEEIEDLIDARAVEQCDQRGGLQAGLQIDVTTEHRSGGLGELASGGRPDEPEVEVGIRLEDASDLGHRTLQIRRPMKGPDAVEVVDRSVRQRQFLESTIPNLHALAARKTVLREHAHLFGGLDTDEAGRRGCATDEVVQPEPRPASDVRDEPISRNEDDVIVRLSGQLAPERRLVRFSVVARSDRRIAIGSSARAHGSFSLRRGWLSGQQRSPGETEPIERCSDIGPERIMSSCAPSHATCTRRDAATSDADTAIPANAVQKRLIRGRVGSGQSD